MVAAATPTYGVYSASKAAGDALTLVLARELRERDITVNAVAPGPTATDLFFTDKDEQTITRLISQTPLERLGMPQQWHSWPAPKPAGSMDKSSGATGASSETRRDLVPAEPVGPPRLQTRRAPRDAGDRRAGTSRRTRGGWVGLISS